ncbi:uncharacterized protein PHACADRAFT_259441 [Phanerochaete carnosa HHB-10118-sp]|uniref:Uncharacterized protein n=1 Tax=Phanerochaete carnosa (strain HHB-10118-sp) TaxID=650164 RepID=K5UTF2_PHACS|nr:uncharacterized protein PHACADRAFT_259441 [Phanerochaete carnosa HHB-10118-sp]EKM53231.1 hypothetical protein PHACADRAFT_259441 [Phanerochaete carnosa HHB-10118-sp]
MEVEFMRMRAEHSQFREELAKYRTNPQVYPVQQPSRERPDRSVTSMSRRTSLSHSAHSVHSPSTRTDAAYLHSETERSIDTSPSISTVLDEARPRRTTRPSVVIPGAPEYKKIIPPLPAPFTFREFNPTSASINSRPPMPPPVSSRSSARVVEPDLAMRPDVRQTSQRSAIEAQTSSYDQVTPRAPTIPHHNRSPQYGYIPGVGYVPTSPPGERSLVSEQDNTQTPAAAGLMLYSQGSQQVDVTNTRTVEGAARAMAIQSGEIETHESTWGHVYHALVSRSNPSSSSLRTAHADSSLQPNASTPTSATSNLNGLGISSPPGRTSGSPAPVIQRRSDASPEPSAASSWGTVSSARSSRASLLEELMSLPGAIANLDVVARPSASRHSSISDLRLAGLPDPTFGDAVDNDGSGRDTPRLHSDRPIRPWPGSDPSLPPQGPSQSSDNTYALASRVSLAHDSGDISRALEPASASAGIGLMLASSASTHQQVSDQDDLQHVNRSLMQLVAEARNSRRRSRPMSLASADDRAEFHSESWEIRAQNVGAALGPDNGSVAQRSAGSLNPAPSSGARDGRDPRSALRQNTVSSTSQATDSARRRRHSNVTFASPPPLTSSVSFHSERQVLSPAIDDRVPSRPQNLGSFTQSSSSMLLDGSSLLLSMPPPGPSTSTATTSTGEPSSIRAPRPVSGLATNIFALWGSRNTR